MMANEFAEMSLGQLFNAAHAFNTYTTQEEQENLQAQLDWELEEIKNLLTDEELAELFGE